MPGEDMEARFGYHGGDFVYSPGSETNPENVLAAAKAAVEAKGGFDALGRGNLFVKLPGLGEHSFDENSTVEGLLAAKQRQETLKSLLHTLTPDQTEEVIEFIGKMQAAK